MTMKDLQSLRDSAKHKLQTKEFAVWNEYEVDKVTGARVLSSGGMCELPSYTFLSSKMLEDDNEVELMYIIQAATWEEAHAVYDLRCYGTHYIPIGNSIDCPTCGDFQVFPHSSNACPQCGKLD